jgi:hypothetical protein
MKDISTKFVFYGDYRVVYQLFVQGKNKKSVRFFSSLKIPIGTAGENLGQFLLQYALENEAIKDDNGILCFSAIAGDRFLPFPASEFNCVEIYSVDRL